MMLEMVSMSGFSFFSFAKFWKEKETLVKFLCSFFFFFVD